MVLGPAARIVHHHLAVILPLTAQVQMGLMHLQGTGLKQWTAETLL